MSELTSPDTLTPPDLPKAPKRRRWLSLLLAAVLFVSGFAAGAGTSVMVIHNRVLAAIHYPNRAPELITNRLRRPLGLTDAQAAQVKKIFQARQASLQDIRRRVQPEVEAQIDLVEQQVAAVLEPDQQKKWYTLLSQLRAAWLPPAPPPASPPQQ